MIKSFRDQEKEELVREDESAVYGFGTKFSSLKVLSSFAN
jgi:hypothetical protein